MAARDLRIWRSAYSNFQKDETLNAAEVYTPAHLQEIARAGFNAIWIHGLLHEIATSPVFPDLARGSAAHLRSLRTVIRRAARCGLRVYIYMQPPRGFPAASGFWKRHPEARGAGYTYHGAEMVAMCTSAPAVKSWLRDAAESLSRRLPGLGGAILITASEYVGHCYSKYDYLHRRKWGEPAGTPLGCPRCERRHPADIVVEIIECFDRGFRAAGEGAEVIAWNWAWAQYDPDPSPKIVARLPKSVRLLVDFERGGTKTILGKTRMIDEYSLSLAGPGRRFLSTLRCARSPEVKLAHTSGRRRGLRVMAKVQIGTTHELATAPNLPLIGNLYEKAKALRRLKVRDFLGCWNFGCMLTANTAAFVRFMEAKRLPPKRAALEEFASGYFPGCNPKQVAQAWEQFAGAMDSFPFCIPFLYFGPANYALEYPLSFGPLEGEPPGRSWLMDPRGDDLSRTLGPYTAGEIIRGLGALTRKWRQAAELLERGLAGLRAGRRGSDAPDARSELNTALVVLHSYHSAWNVYRAWRLRKDWNDGRRGAMLAIMRDESAHLEQVLPIVAADRRMGFHSECQAYMFTPAGIRRKLRTLALAARRAKR